MNVKFKFENENIIYSCDQLLRLSKNILEEENFDWSNFKVGDYVSSMSSNRQYDFKVISISEDKIILSDLV